MNQPLIEECGERTVYTCLLWNVRSGQPTVVTIHDEHPDRWMGRRCTVAATSFETPLEMFMKSDWRRTEPPALEEPKEVHDPATATATATAMHKRSARGFHP